MLLPRARGLGNLAKFIVLMISNVLLIIIASSIALPFNSEEEERLESEES